MSNERICDAYRLLYENRDDPTNPLHGHNNPDLLARWGVNPHDLETQILCKKNGTPIEGGKFEADGEVFGPTRWPYDAMGEPNFSNPPIQYIIRNRMRCIGSTWWNWKKRCSVGLGFDFDSLLDHGEGVGISEHELKKIDAIETEWLEVIRSTRGNGRHLYIWFQDPYPVTMNHDEHAALARAYIPLIAKYTGLDIEANVDCCGSVLWFHHENATPENRGYEVIKPATQILDRRFVPPNWKDHLEVVSGGRSKVRVQGWTADGTQTSGDELDEMTEAFARVELEEIHMKVLEALEQTGHSSLWVHDHHLWQGHTAGLKDVFEDFAERGHPLKGIYETTSQDTDPGKPNCLCADTKVITRQGVKPIGELAGKDVEIITSRGAWVTVPFKSFGEQEVFAVTIENRNNRKVIRATGDHRWYVTKYRSDGKRKTKLNFGEREQVVTKDLTEGRVLVQTKPRCNHTPSVVGIQHGLVWGDGTNGGTRACSSLSLFGEKDAELLKYFAEHPQRPITQSVGGVEVWNLPHHFKSLVPLHYDKAYLYGWLAGYFAADGCVSDSGACVIRSADKGSIEHVRQVCHILGVETSKITTSVSSGYKKSTIYTTVLKAADLSEEFFLLTPHRERWASTTNRQHHYWRVVSVEPAGREEVFCCTVPETHCFVLEDFILIGNCFMRPKPGGGWDVYRFGQGAEEHDLWDTQGKWTHIQFNCDPSLRQVSIACGGFESPEAKMGFIFSDLSELVAALKMLKSKITPPILKDKDGNELKDGYGKRQLSLREDDFGRVVLCIQKKGEDDSSQFKGFAKTPRGWERVITDAIELAGVDEELLFNELDNKLRCLKICGETDRFDDWVIRDEGGKWVIQPRENVKALLATEGMTKPDPILGQAVYKPWEIVNLPFQPEYPGGRRWNRDGIQFAYTPLEIKDGSVPIHKHWDIILNHCGKDLDEYIPDLHWADEWGIVNGGDYLRAWVACMFRYPECKLPYLFMYGVQNSGKSTIHEALAELLVNKKGVARADRAMTSVNGYNGELMGAILAVVDEIDVANSGPDAYNRLKDWTTGTSIAIHAKHKTVIQVPNTLHFMQFGNSRDNLPVFQGDTRITAMCVDAPEEDIPKDLLFERLREEAPAFLRTLLDMDIPEAIGRLRLPIIETRGKKELMESNKDYFELFIEERCNRIDGARMKWTDFKKELYKDMDDVQKSILTEQTVRKRLSEMGLPIGRGAGNVTCIGNLTFDDTTTVGNPYVLKGSRLVREEEV